MKRAADGQLIFSPSDLLTFFKSPYISWIQHFNQTVPLDKRIEKVEDPTRQMLARKGDEFEREEFARRRQGRTVEIARDKDFTRSFEATLKAMREGADVIYQGALRLGRFEGYTDFMHKVPGRKSKLGDYSYEVYDTKLARSPKPEYALQIGCYNEMLAAILGHWPERWHLILGGETASFPSCDFRYYYEHFKDCFLKFHAEFEVSKPPAPEPWEDVRGYEAHVTKLFQEQDHLTLVAGMMSHQIRRLKTAGIQTRRQLADASLKQKPARMKDHIFEKLREQAALQLESEKTGQLAFRVLKPEPGTSHGLARLPDPDEGDVMFDMEGDPMSSGGLEYLFGVYFKEKGKWVYRDWRATESAQEKNAFCGFMEWLIARYRQYPGMHVYHYAKYEESAISALSNKYSCKVSEVDTLLRNDVLVDLYKVVREGVRVGAESYSIKKLEPLYDFKRSSEVTNAGDSIVQFDRYQEVKLADPAAAEKIFDEIVAYNKEDVVSTLGLLEWLRAQKKKQGIEFVTPLEEISDIEPLKDWEELNNRLLARRPKWIKTDEQKRLSDLVAGFCGYFQREERPVWWAHFYRQDMDPIDLYDDPECLVLARVVRQGQGKAVLEFDPDQDLKLKEGSRLCLHGGSAYQTIEVTKLDLNGGKAEVSFRRNLELPDEITLIPGSPVPTKSQQEILMKLGENWAAKGETAVPSAALDLLYRRPARVKGVKPGQALYTEGEPPLDAALRLAKGLESSCLSIQGPPGTGKTFTGAHIICHLLKAGKRVAVVSQGKKTVEHLLEKVAERWTALGFNGHKLAILMADGNGKGEKSAAPIRYMDNTGARKEMGRYNLVGGTHWVFAHSSLSAAPFDYLFIDEAGQFSLAAAVACSFAAKNIVLLGDQMQLEQVNTGAHPDECGHSVLNYYMQGQSTIPRTHGVFLDETWRMHPSICEFVSELVYENRLRANRRTSAHRLGLPAALAARLQDSGILFLEVDHEGNSIRSEEEAARIAELLAELKKAKVPGENGKPRAFTGGADDLIIITPYNAQVELLRARLPGAKVGSVDLFQGQEAWISVLSMCASGEEGLHRGLDFLLSKNRMNVGLSRAKALSVVVGSPRLLDIRPTQMDTIPLLNFYAALRRAGLNKKSEKETA